MGVLRLIAIMLKFVVLGSLCGSPALVGESSAQGLPSDFTSQSPPALDSQNTVGSPVPFGSLEKRLRQSPRWQEMTPEEQAQALEKIKRARQQFLHRQQQLNIQYGDQVKKGEKPRESLMSKRRKREQYQEANILWSRFQDLPIDRRLAMERQLGLDSVMPSQQQQEFQTRLDGLSYSKRNHILRQLQKASP